MGLSILMNAFFSLFLSLFFDPIGRVVWTKLHNAVNQPMQAPFFFYN